MSPDGFRVSHLEQSCVKSPMILARGSIDFPRQDPAARPNLRSIPVPSSRWSRWWILVLALGASGCSSYPAVDVPVTGIVRIDGVPSKGTAVFFIPTDRAKHAEGLIGQGFTNEAGEFVLRNPNGEERFFAGEFKVTFTRYLDPKGNPIPIEIKPDDVGAKQQLPSAYINPESTPFTVVVNQDQHVFTFDLKTRGVGVDPDRLIPPAEAGTPE